MRIARIKYWRLLVSICGLLAACLLMLFVWSFWWNFRVEREGKYRQADFQIAVSRGRVAVIYDRKENADVSWGSCRIHAGDGSTYETRAFDEEEWSDVSLHRFARLGFAYENTVGHSLAGFWRLRRVMFPALLPAIAVAVPPIISLRALMRARARRRKGLCQRCGYDLRASPARCPECGLVPSESAEIPQEAPAP